MCRKPDIPDGDTCSEQERCQKARPPGLDAPLHFMALHLDHKPCHLPTLSAEFTRARRMAQD